MEKLHNKYYLWAICATLWATIGFIVPDFIDTPPADFINLLQQIGYILALYISSFFVLYIIGLNKYITVVFLPIFAIVGAGVAYFRIAQHAVVTPMIVDVTLNTNITEAQSVISWQMYVYIAFHLLLSIFFIRWRLKIQSFPRKWLHGLIGIILLLIYYNCNARLHNSINQRYPYNIVYSLHEYWRMQQVRNLHRETPQVRLTQTTDTLNVIFVIGEAMRADHLGLNGYRRNTTPRLEQRSNLISLPYITTEQTYTSMSVPYILTPTHPTLQEKKHTSKSFISCFSSCDFKTAWISNQDFGKTYSSFIQEADTIIFPNADKNYYVYYEWLDEDLISPTNTHTNYSKKLSVLHTIGSHWYYNNHVSDPFKIYQPVTTTQVVTRNTQEQFINSYDNTVLYLDYFLDTLIKTVESQRAIVIYLSDHGESLGENGRYFHANDAPECKNPACVIWYSDKYKQAFPEKVKALHQNRTKLYKTDFLFYSILSAAGINPVDNRPELDIFTLSE